MGETADVIIVGAGVIGLSCAYQIARRSRLRVTVLEQSPSLGAGSTGASSAVCRFRYTYDEMVRLARDGVAVYRGWPEFLRVRSPRAMYQNTGVLWLSGDGQTACSAEAERLARMGVVCEVLDDQNVRGRFPAINTCTRGPDPGTGLPHVCSHGGQHLLEIDGGFIDPMDVLQDLADAARAAGVRIVTSRPAAGFLQAGGRVTGVRTADGEVHTAGMTVCAAGPWTSQLLGAAGLSDWPLEPARIQIVHLDRPPGVTGTLPVTVDLAGGIYFRPQNRGQQIIVGSVLAEDENERVTDPDRFAATIDDEYAAVKLHALDHRLHDFTYSGRVRGYSGLYTINRTDGHPVVGETPLAGLCIAAGMSGHGFKLAPAIGALIARAVTGTADSSDPEVDAGFLSYSRNPIALSVRSALA